MPRTICFLIYPRFQLLDVSGPIAAFEIAERLQPGSYTLKLVAAQPGDVESSAGFTLRTTALPRADRIDTLIVSGGDGSRDAMQCALTQQFIVSCYANARRVTSVCSGTYLLAASGILDGKTATTHWSRAQHFSRVYPRVNVDADRIYVRSGKIWTSAGITAGIDLSLALIAHDLGEDLARRVAQYLVVYHRRPGGQSQFSALLEMESNGDRFAELLDYMRANLRKPLNVADLAARVHMSTRHFARAFRDATGATPAKAVERMRTEAARALLESGKRSVQEVARACGFGQAERMRRTFIRTLGVSPLALKRRSA